MSEEGSTGLVYEAVAGDGVSIVALKVLFKSLDPDDQIRYEHNHARMMQESMLLQNMTHPNVLGNFGPGMFNV